MADWKYETDESIKARLDTAKEAQSRTRFSLVLMVFVSVMMSVASYNAYYSYDYQWALKVTDSLRTITPSSTSKRSPADILTEQALRSWSDARNVSIPVLGIRASIDDVPILGTGALLLISLWLMLSARRENHTIGFLLRDTDTTPPDIPEGFQLYVKKRRWQIFHSVVANTLLVDFSQSFTRISKLTKRNPISQERLSAPKRWMHKELFLAMSAFFFFFPVVVSLIVYFVDTRSYDMRDPFWLGAPPPGCEEPFFTISRWLFFVCWIPLLSICLQAWRYSKATESLLREYYAKVELDQTPPIDKENGKTEKKPESKWRDATVDRLRGLAIFTMVAANMAGYVLEKTCPLWLRYYGSFAAPLFITIAGMMVVKTSAKTGGDSHEFMYYLQRGLLIIGVGALVDLAINNIYPFMTIDVLYLIGIALPLTYLLRNAGRWMVWIVPMAVFLATPIIQTNFGYAGYPLEVSLNERIPVGITDITKTFHQWLVDGWFPVFPWLGFSFLGVGLAWLRRLQSDSNKLIATPLTVSLIGLALLVFGICLRWIYPGDRFIRGEYSELFYPPTIGYIVTASGLIFILFGLSDHWRRCRWLEPLRVVGESSLFFYILHLAVIRYIIEPLFHKGSTVITFMFVYVCVFVILVLIAYSIKRLKAEWEIRPFAAKFFLGS
jgi:uncharacterized membrane protein